MGANYTVTSAKMSNGNPDQYGNIPWWIDLTDGEQSYTAMMMRKDDSPTPQGPMYGRLETKTSRAGNEYLRFYTEQNPDNGQQPPPRPGAGAQQGHNPPPKPNTAAIQDERTQRIEAQSARRDAIAYAAMMAAHTDMIPTIHDVKLWAKELALDEKVAAPPSPAPSGGTPEAAPQAAPVGGQPAVDFASQDIRLALAACGQDNSNPVENYGRLDKETQAQVDLIYMNLQSKGETQAGEPDPDGWKTPDDEVDF